MCIYLHAKHGHAWHDQRSSVFKNACLCILTLYSSAIHKKKKWSCLITAITKKSSGGQICPPPGTDPNFFNPVQIGLKNHTKLLYKGFKLFH